MCYRAWIVRSCRKARLPEIAFWKIAAKRGIDFVCGAIGFVLILPLFGLITLSLLWIDKRTMNCVLLGKIRIGKDGKKFTAFTFNTYDEQKRKLTRLGIFIEKGHLNSLPLFINLLRGEMSLVGPRPMTPDSFLRNEKEQAYMKDLKMRPGLTGWAMVNGDRSLDADRWYTENFSFWLDLKIMARTVKIVLFPQR